MNNSITLIDFKRMSRFGNAKLLDILRRGNELLTNIQEMKHFKLPTPEYQAKLEDLMKNVDIEIGDKLKPIMSMATMYLMNKGYNQKKLRTFLELDTIKRAKEPQKYRPYLTDKNINIHGFMEFIKGNTIKLVKQIKS